MINLFGARSVASITASLTSMVKQLEQHAEVMVQKASDHASTARHYNDLCEKANDEVSKAKAAAAKIGSLFS